MPTLTLVNDKTPITQDTRKKVVENLRKANIFDTESLSQFEGGSSDILETQEGIAQNKVENLAIGLLMEFGVEFEPSS